MYIFSEVLQFLGIAPPLIIWRAWCGFPPTIFLPATIKMKVQCQSSKVPFIPKFLCKTLGPTFHHGTLHGRTTVIKYTYVTSVESSWHYWHDKTQII